MGNKLLNTGVDHFLNDEEFRNSELGRTYQDIEKKTKVNVKLKNSPLASVASIEDVEVAANQNSAYFKMKTQSLSTKMNYSVQSQNMDILFHRPESSHQSIGVGYDPKSDTSQVKMQVDW
ncbi:MAG: hypothetical protein IPM57_11455 [Oligoflexia bacterium]|nr:hypothetical protein [Oligoflexia bacterium]